MPPSEPLLQEPRTVRTEHTDPRAVEDQGRRKVVWGAVDPGFDAALQAYAAGLRLALGSDSELREIDAAFNGQ